MNLPPTIVHNLARGRENFANRTLVIADEHAISFVAFAELVEGAARRLADEGMRPGDRLAVCLRNGLDIAVAIWACARGGFVFVGLPTHLGPAGWQALIAHADPALVLAHPEFLPGLPSSARPVGDILTGTRLPWRQDAPLPDPDDVYALIYTSGTTGHPKAVTVTHRAAMHVAGLYRELLGLTPEDVTAIHLPFSYVSGHISQLNPFMLAGGSAVPMSAFSARSLIETARECGVTVFDMVPWMLHQLLRERSFTPVELPQLRAVFFGGAPMPIATLGSLRERFPGLRLYNVYGMSETAGIITVLNDTDIDPHPDTVGRAAPGARIRIGEGGEVLVQGPMVTRGYWHNPSSTNQNIQGGWLHTGDTGSIDSAGYLSVSGRVTDIINRAGLKIAPQDVEQALLADPAVAEAAAIGIPDGAAGQVVVACVVAVPGTQIDLDTVRGLVRRQLPVHARPRQIRVLDQLPRNPTGKIDRAALHKLFG